MAIDRKAFLKSIGVSTVALFSEKLLATPFSEIGDKNFTRIAHLTDIHIFDDTRAIDGTAKAIDYIKNLAVRPDFVFTGGDSIMDSLGKSKAETKAQWKIWHLATESLAIPRLSCIGNHDVWGWSLPFVKNKPSNDYSKKWAADELKMSNRYYTTKVGNWKVIVLDSTYPIVGLGYQAKIDNEQYEWLEGELKSATKDEYICVLSHIPILSVTTFFDGKTEIKSGGYKVSRANQHSDGRKLKNLFYQYPNVKAALSGHIHLVDEVNYLGVKYCCNGAVCGAWWNGKYQEFGPALAIVDLYDDGRVENKVVYY